MEEHLEYCDECGEPNCNCNTAIWSVSVYLIDRAYGGPEEGGWYYECGQPVLEDGLPFPVYVKGRKAAYAAMHEMQKAVAASGINTGRREISSMLSEGMYAALTCKGFPRHFPETIPHYE